MLEDLRQQIDTIDDHIHDLLQKRASLLEEIIAAKQEKGLVSAYQPDREIAVLRRLCARHESSLPIELVLRIWREMMTRFLSLQSDFRVAVFDPSLEESLWDLARDHFGSFIDLLPAKTTQATLRALSEERATAALLPLPQEGEENPWWLHLVAPDNAAPRIVGRVPFIGATNSRGADHGFIVSHVAIDAKAQDRTFFALELGEDMSRSRVQDLLAKTELDLMNLLTWRDPAGIRAPLYLLEVKGGLTINDPEIKELEGVFNGSIQRILRLGGYVLPNLTLSEAVNVDQALAGNAAEKRSIQQREQQRAE